MPGVLGGRNWYNKCAMDKRYEENTAFHESRKFLEPQPRSKRRSELPEAQPQPPQGEVAHLKMCNTNSPPSPSLLSIFQLGSSLLAAPWTPNSCGHFYSQQVCSAGHIQGWLPGFLSCRDPKPGSPGQVWEVSIIDLPLITTIHPEVSPLASPSHDIGTATSSDPPDLITS